MKKRYLKLQKSLCKIPLLIGAINKKIKANNLIPYQCSCGITNKWNNKPITLQLEHKNGISNDNRIENLEYLCPNCHSQTSSYMGHNVHNRVFAERLKDIKLLKSSVITSADIKNLSSTWKIEVGASKRWIKQYIDKINMENIFLDEKIITFKSKKIKKEIDIKEALNKEKPLQYLSDKWGLEKIDIKKWLQRHDFDTLHKDFEIKSVKPTNIVPKLSQKEILEMRTNDVKEAIKNNNPIDYLSKLWGMTRNQVTRWIKYNKMISYHPSFNLSENTKKTKPLDSRQEDFHLLKTKFDLPDIGKKWGMSTNGAKKWLKYNFPDKFNEIYNNSSYVYEIKNKEKEKRAAEISNLSIEDFDIEVIKAKYNTNGAGLSSLLKLYNPNLFEIVFRNSVCIYCNNEARSCGTYKGQNRYKCISENCKKSYTL